tara:strand:+ start:41 stop:355 length:315 start_codon:yes stop_codon:yes gene_type:complete
MVSICGVLLIGIEIKCGMIGYGVILVGILGVHHTGGHHLGMIDGVIMYIMVGIITDGDTTDTTVMVGITIMVGTTTTDKIIGTEDEVGLMCHISMVEEVRLVMK